MATDALSISDAPTTAKRASGRVRKQPDHFTSSAFSTAKRKRGRIDDAEDDEDAEMVEDNDDEEEEDDDEDDEPAEEETREKAKRARKPKGTAPKPPAQKKPKVNGVSLPIRGAGKAPAKRRAPKKIRAADVADAEAAGGIYAALFAHGKPAEEVVGDWLKSFDENEAVAVADLVNFVLKAAGCNSKVTQHDIEDPDSVTARLTDLQEEYQATEPTDYPIIAKGKSATAFKTTLTHFFNHLIRAMGANGYLTTNPELIENIDAWLSTMTSASNRSFRHTATVCSLAILTALCEVGKEYATKAADHQRHADGERKKPRANKERVKQLQEKAKAASTDLEFVESRIKDAFDVIFIHRYRDVNPAVRRDCVEGLGDWIVILPEQFLDGNHLRYMGWLLSDEAPVVRLEALKQLHRLYDDSDKVGGLKTFTDRFRARFVEIGTSDADIGVRVAGLELLDLLHENDLLEPDDLDAIGKLVFHDDVKVRKAVSGFFSAIIKELYSGKIEDLGGQDALEEVLPDPSEDNFEIPRLEWLQYKVLAEMLQVYDEQDALPSQAQRDQVDGTLILNAAGVDSRFTLAVDVLYDQIDELQQWKALAGYLLFDHSPGRASGARKAKLAELKQATALSENEEIVLLEMLNASANRSLSDLAEKITGTKAKLGKKQKDELQEEQEEAVRLLTDIIPRLLKKFGDVPNTAGAVLRLGAVLALPSLQGLRHDSSASAALLQDLRKQFMSHGTDEVLAPATAAILHAHSYGELDETALEKVNSLWEDVVSNLAELLNADTVTVRGVSPQEELSALSNNLLRIVRLSQVSNPIQYLEDESVAQTSKRSGTSYIAAIDFIMGLLYRAVNTGSDSPDPEQAVLEDLVAARAAEAALFYFRWKLSKIMDAIKTGFNGKEAYEDEAVMESLATRRDTFVENIGAVLDSRKANDLICVTVANSLLDMYTSSAVLRTEKAQPGMSDDYTILIMDLSSEHEKAIMKVFVALEKEYARLVGKKLEDLVSENVELNPDADPIDDDPISDDEEEEDTDAAAQRQTARAVKPVIVEERLCTLTTKLVWAIIAGVIDDKAIRKRLERNRTKLGANFKEVLAYLDISIGSKSSAKGKTRPKAKAPGADGPAAKQKKVNPKSNAIVAEDEEEDEIEDLDPEEAELRRLELEIEDDEQPVDEDEEMANGAD